MKLWQSVTRALRATTAPATTQRRQLLTLAIESSCDDTCVAILEKKGQSAKLHFHKKITSDNRQFGGIHPSVAVASHTACLANLVQESLGSLPAATRPEHLPPSPDVLSMSVPDGGVSYRVRPDFVTVTRGPGMTPSLSTGLNTAKGLSVAWQIPFLGVNHMQAHALTPRLVRALGPEGVDVPPEPAFPFLTLLVSGGHTLLVHSLSLCDHQILAQASNIAIGDLIDKCARAILPPDLVAAQENVMYGPLLESFAFPNGEMDYAYTAPKRRRDEIEPFESGHGWSLDPPLAGSRAMEYNFSSLNGAIMRIAGRETMEVSERQLLARATMKLAFEHLASRLCFFLSNNDVTQAVKTLVVSGGVASNRFLMHVLRSILVARGFGEIDIIAPPPALCTDNAAMIAWTGMEMFEAGYRTDLSVLAKRKWPIDTSQEGGILGTDGWININERAQTM